MRALRLVYLIAGIFLIGAAGFAAYASTKSLLEARASNRWPSVPGTVTSTRTIFIVGRHGSTGPDIRYTYTVAGRQFHGTRLEVVSYSSNGSYASDALHQFQDGANVPVYYDPAHPERAVLRRGPNWLGYALPLLSVAMVLFGVALVRLALPYGVAGRGP